MQTQGSLSDGGLGALLETMQAERATGTLSIQNGSDSCSMYFLFGHLFHATSSRAQGEEVVVNALSWHEGTFQFDPRAKLPAEETIKASPAELIEAAQNRQPVAASGQAGDSYFSAIVDPAHGNLETAFEPYVPPSATPGPESYPEPEIGSGDSGLASWAASQSTAEAPLPEPLSYPTPVPAPERDQPPVPQPAYQPPEPAPLPTSGPYSVMPAAFGATDAATGSEFYPLPSGRAHYEGLKSAFVDFPRLLRTLRADRHTGYVRVSGTGAASYAGFILLHEGHAQTALCTNGAVTEGETAFLHIRRHMDEGDGGLDVVELDGDIVKALARLYSGPPIFVGLLGRFVDIDALLEYLSEEKIDGSVIVTTDDNLGVIVLSLGAVLGSYTDKDRSLDESAEKAASLAHERSARIEVKGAPTRSTALDVDAALTLPY